MTLHHETMSKLTLALTFPLRRLAYESEQRPRPGSCPSAMVFSELPVSNLAAVDAPSGRKAA
jgi:hypothetical protein